MSPAPEISVVVPVFNNRATLDELIDRQVHVLEEMGAEFELVFVDDGSRDASLELLRRRAEADPRIRVFALTRNFGGQSAMCAAFDQARGKRVVCMDADLENFPEDIPRLLAGLDEGHDLVCGVREARRSPLIRRRIPSLLINAYVRRQTGTHVRDIGCAMRAMEARLVRDLESEGEKRRLITPLLLQRAHSVTEVPIQHVPKESGGGHSFFSLLGIAMDYYLLTARRPFLLSGTASAVALVLGLVGLLGGGGVAALLIVLAGLLGGLVSLLGEYVQRLYQVGQALPFYQLRRDLDEDAPPAAPSGNGPIAEAAHLAFAAGLGLAACWLAPGAALVRWLDLGRDPLERFVLAIALGRIVLAVVSLVAASTVGPIGIHALAIAGPIAWWTTRHRVRPQPEPLGATGPIALAIAAAVVLVVAVVGGVGLPSGDGTLGFPDSDATRDPLVYASLALRLAESGLPLSYPFTSGASTTTTYLPYGVMVGLHAMGASMLDVATRIVPLAEASALAISAVALVRALGHSRGAAALAGVLVVLGGEPSYWLGPLAAPFGVEVRPLASWSFFGPFLFAFNPVTPALQMSFAALLLVAAMPGEPERAPERRRLAVVAGGIVALSFETKVFVWAPMIGGLALLAFAAAPPALARALRLSAIVALLGSAPFLVEKLAWARELAGRDLTAFVACPGCLPRYLADAALGSHDITLRSFDAFEWRMLASPVAIAKTGFAVVLTVAIALGGRVAAVPELWRGARACDPALAAVHRWIALAATLGLGAAMLFTTRPHYLNGLQFAWVATAGLWPFAAVAVARWTREAKRLWLFAMALLVVPGSWASLVELGASRPTAHRVSPDQLAFMREIERHVPPDAFVLEPSILIESGFPSPVTWQAGRSVYLSLMSAAKILPREELLRRRDRLVAVFGSDDRDAALEAIAATAAGWLYAPVAVPLRFAPGLALEEVAAGPAGKLYRVAPTAGGRGGGAR